MKLTKQQTAALALTRKAEKADRHAALMTQHDAFKREIGRYYEARVAWSEAGMVGPMPLHPIDVAQMARHA